MGEVSRAQAVSRAEEEQRRELTKDELTKITEQHGGLVRMVAGRLAKTYGESVEDLMQIGYIGLIKAARRFEPERGLQFSTYAVPMIAGEIKSQIRDHGLVKMSRSLKSDIVLVRRTESELLKKNGVAPRLTEIASEAGMEIERVQEACQAADALQNMCELDSDQAERISALRGDYEEQNVNRMDLKAALAGLEPDARKVIVLRYYRDFTQQQVANLMGISQVQVCRIEKRTLKKMAESMG